MIPGMVEILVVIAIVAVVFGPGKLPDVMQAIGKGVKDFNDGVKEARKPLAPSTEDEKDRSEA